MIELEDQLFSIYDDIASGQALTFNQLTPLLVDASTLIVQCLLSEGRIIACGTNDSAALAQIFCANLFNKFEQERPSLPAFTLSTDGVSITSVAESDHYNDIFSKQLYMHGQANDIFFVISPDGKSAPLLQAVQAAHDQSMIVIALTAQDGGELCRILSHEDIEIRVPIEHPKRATETHLVLLNCLCYLIEQQLFYHA